MDPPHIKEVYVLNVANIGPHLGKLNCLCFVNMSIDFICIRTKKFEIFQHTFLKMPSIVLFCLLSFNFFAT